MKKWRVRLTLDGRTVETIINAANYWDAKKLIEAQYPKAMSISITEES